MRRVVEDVIIGYKGGRYIMGEDTPVWVSGYGDVSGLRLMALHPGGGVEAQEEEA